MSKARMRLTTEGRWIAEVPRAPSRPGLVRLRRRRRGLHGPWRSARWRIRLRRVRLTTLAVDSVSAAPGRISSRCRRAQSQMPRLELAFSRNQQRGPPESWYTALQKQG